MTDEIFCWGCSNIERLHHSLNKKSLLQCFCDIINSNKSDFSKPAWLTHLLTISCFKILVSLLFCVILRTLCRRFSFFDFLIWKEKIIFFARLQNDDVDFCKQFHLQYSKYGVYYIKRKEEKSPLKNRKILMEPGSRDFGA